MEQIARHRPIRSYVLRQGRLTPAQARALAQDFTDYGIPIEANQPQPMNWMDLFHRDAPRILEIGFGMGDVLVDAAYRHPDKDFIGVEVHPPGVGRCIAMAKEKGCRNIKVCRDDIMTLLPLIPSHSIDAVWIFFPDPWHKKRHQKRRLIQPALMTDLSRILKNKGTCHIATDWEDYAQHILSVCEHASQFVNVHGPNQFAPIDPTRPKSKFQQRGERLGHAVWEFVYQLYF